MAAGVVDSVMIDAVLLLWIDSSWGEGRNCEDIDTTKMRAELENTVENYDPTDLAKIFSRVRLIYY